MRVNTRNETKVPAGSSLFQLFVPEHFSITDVSGRKSADASATDENENQMRKEERKSNFVCDVVHLRGHQTFAGEQCSGRWMEPDSSNTADLAS